MSVDIYVKEKETAMPHGQNTHQTSEKDTARQPWTILVLLAIAQFMVILDVTVVNVALPSIGADLGFAPEDLQWVVTAYVLFTGGLLLLGGRAADMLGRRRILLSGLTVFTVASLASGLAASPGMLIASRAAQGFGAAMLLPAALSTVTATYTGSQRTTALSIWGAIAAGGAVVGMVVGGMLTSWLSWEWIFFINVPIGLVAIPLAVHLIRPAAGTGGLRQLDVFGASTLVGGLVALIYGVEGTSTHGWGSTRTLGLLAAGTALLVVFALVERGASRPLIPPSTWRIRSLTSGVGMMLGATGFLVGVLFLSSLYVQGTLGWSALEAGFAFLPLMLAIIPVSHLAPHALTAFGTKGVLTSGLLLMAAGAALLALAPDRATYATELLPGFVVIGVGLGLVFVTIQVTSMSEVRERTAGLASGMVTTGHEIGAALGVAVFSAVAVGTGSGALAGLGSPSGYGDGLTVAGLVAAGMAALAAATVPSIRPASAAHVSMH
jgi:EmrB/QacA subfamily drug resistance transporter